jgi:hypothetical protein
MASELRLIGSYWVGASGAGNAITAATPTSITFMANVNDNSVINGAEATPSPTTTGNSVPLSITAGQTGDAFKVYQNPADNDYIYIANGGRREVKQITDINGSTLTLASALSSPYSAAGSLVRDVKIITYTRNASATSTCPTLTCLTRTQGGSGADPIVDNVSGLTFFYFLSNGVTPTTDPALIREIQIDLTVCIKRTPAASCQDPDSSSRQMTTRVKPRSLP